MYCPHCGVKNDRGESDCYICNARLPALQVAPDSPQRPQRRKAAEVETGGTVGDRALALLFDSALLAASLTLLAAWLTVDGGAIDLRSGRAGAATAAVVITTVFLYHFLLEAAFGATLGKAMMGLRVRNIGDRPRVVAALLRNLLRIVDAQLLYLVGFLVALFTSRRQRLGDRVAGTVVMELPRRVPLRAGMMILWVVLVASALIAASSICPTCRVDPRVLPLNSGS